MGCRGLTQPETSHPKWNSYKRAVTAAELDYDVLRLTVCANYSHGPWGAGDRLVLKQQMLAAFLKKQPKEYFADIAQEIFRDQGSTAAPSAEDAAFMLEDFMSTDALRNRGKFVKTKAWFGMINSFRDLLHNWTVQREAATAVLHESGGAVDAEPDEGDQDERPRQPEPEAAPPPKKWTKADLYKAYKGRGPHSMNAEFLQDESLRSTAVLLVRITSPLCLGRIFSRQSVLCGVL